MMRQTIVYQVTAHNDEYHGGDYGSDVFFDRKKAEEEVAYLEANKPPCSQCDHRTRYSIQKVNLYGEMP